MKNLKDINVLVLGLGATGLSMAVWCARNGARVSVWDSREAPPQAPDLAELVPTATLTSGPLEPSLLDGVQRVFRSPGLAPSDGRIAPLLAMAAERGIPVQGELDLFVQALADLKADGDYEPQVLAITGTNGKTTTTSMTTLLVKRAGKRVACAGNIGSTMLGTLVAALDRAQANDGASEGVAHLPEVWVLELSSFQLHDVQGFEPSASAVLNIAQDHLDWHGSMQAYVANKARIFGGNGVIVFNQDDAAVREMVSQAMPEKAAVKSRHAKPVPRTVVRFGRDIPQQPGDFGLMVDNGMTWLVRAHEADPTHKLRRGEAHEVVLQRLMPADALRVRGRHNAANALAALALASAIGCPLAPLLHGLREYRGEPHRVTFIGTIRDVDAYDDSKGTNVGATVAALDGLGADRAPAKLVVILGGDGKGQDFSPLLSPVQRHARGVALIGRDAGLIEQALGASGVAMQRCESLESATRWAFEQAHAGDAVVLSPACASLDMFRNFGHRAEVFVAAVQAMAHELGVLV